MLRFCLAALATLRVFLQSRADTSPEILALRQQIAVLKRQRPRLPLHPGDRLFWTILRRFWPRWADALLIVQPETVLGWHRAGFRFHWRWHSRSRRARPRMIQELRDLITRLAKENTDWGALKIRRLCPEFVRVA